MSEIVNLSERRPPTVYTVTIAHHWDGTLEYQVEDVSDDERSRKSVLDALQKIGGLQAAADKLHKELLEQINALMEAGPASAEALKLSRLADMVQEYETARFP